MREHLTEFSGTLVEAAGLAAIVRFLIGLKKTGYLLVVYEDWRGEISFDTGQVTGARLGSRHGLSALDALVQALPGSSFTFHSSATVPEVDISLSPEAVQLHLDSLVASVANGLSRVPALRSVPVVVETYAGNDGEHGLPFDRAMLRTLRAVDGKRTVREIVAQCGSSDALWDLRYLAEMGLVRLGSADRAPEPTPLPHGVSGAVQPPSPAVEAHQSPLASPASPPGVDPARCSTPPARVELVASLASQPRLPSGQPAATLAEATMPLGRACPKLGFENTPANCFERPTRLHRCFADGEPMALSLGYQREVCLTETFGSCPRLGSH